MPKAFEIGDKVQRIIGGAVMTVSYTPFPAPRLVWCSWMLNEVIFGASFRTDTLRRIETTSPVQTPAGGQKDVNLREPTDPPSGARG
jgi:uncharacterized protein YodC (DUF2158 family)